MANTRSIRPAIARRCAKVWTPRDDRQLRERLAELRGDIESAGGLEGWIATRLEAWVLDPASCPVAIRRPRVRA